MKPWCLPSGLQRGLPFIIADHWSPEQALAVVELLDDLRDVISRKYQLQLYALLREQRQTSCSSEFSLNATDEPPF